MTQRTEPARDPATVEQDRRDLQLILQEAAEPVTLHVLARDTWDGLVGWPGHVDRVYRDLDALRRAGLVVTDGAPYAGNQAAVWAPADSPLGDRLSDRAEVARLSASWEPVDLPEVPC